MSEGTPQLNQARLVKALFLAFLSLTAFGTFLLIAGPTAAATAVLLGRVTDGSGHPLLDSTIAINAVGTTNQVVSGTIQSDGTYTISVSPGSYDVVVSPPVESGFHSATFGDFYINGTTNL